MACPTEILWSFMKLATSGSVLTSLVVSVVLFQEGWSPGGLPLPLFPGYPRCLDEWHPSLWQMKHFRFLMCSAFSLGERLILSTVTISFHLAPQTSPRRSSLDSPRTPPHSIIFASPLSSPPPSPPFTRILVPCSLRSHLPSLSPFPYLLRHP